MGTTMLVKHLGVVAALCLLAVAGVGCDSSKKSSSSPTTSNRVSRPFRNVTHSRATLGRAATFKCSGDGIKGKKMVSWVRYRDVNLLAVGKFVYTPDDRFKVLHEPGSDDWFLVINSVGYGDEGVYECQVSAPLDSRKQKFVLSVVEPRTEILGERELFVDFASSLNLTCVVVSPDPPAYVFWKKNDKLVDVSESSPSSPKSPKALKLTRNHSKTADGSSPNSPPVEVSDSEHRFGSGLDDSDNVRILFSRDSPRAGVTSSSLVIDRVDSTHSGVFSCIPSNSDEQSIRVHVLKDNSRPAAIHTENSNSAGSVASPRFVWSSVIALTVAKTISW